MPASALGLLELAFIALIGSAWGLSAWWSLRRSSAKTRPPADPPGA